MVSDRPSCLSLSSFMDNNYILLFNFFVLLFQLLPHSISLQQTPLKMCRQKYWLSPLRNWLLNSVWFLTIPLAILSLSVHSIIILNTSSSVDSKAGCQSRVCEFEFQLGQYSFGSLTKMKHMSRWTGCHDLTETLLKMALSPKSIKFIIISHI